MPGGIVMVLLGALVIAQVTRGQALQRLGIIGSGQGGGSGLFGDIQAVGAGIGWELTHPGGLP